MTLKSFLRKITPLRASTYEKQHRAEMERIAALENQITQLTKAIKSLEKTLSASDRKARESLGKKIDRATAKTSKEIEDHSKLVRALSNESKSREERILYRTETVRSFHDQWRSNAFGYDHQRRTLPEDYPRELRRWYKERVGNDLNLDKPTTFNEKIQWLKIYDSNNLERKAQLADKLRCKQIVASLIGEEKVIPVFGQWSEAKSIDWDALPESFVLKCNHGCGYNIIVEDKSEVNREQVMQKLDFWMTRDYAYSCGFEMHYSLIKPAIFAEEYISQDKPLMEFQVWCFNESVRFISVIHDPHGENAKLSYSPTWEELDFITSPPRLNHPIDRPMELETLIHDAELLSKGFPFARVDFFITDDNRLLHSETTFTPGSGMMRWEPPETDNELGVLLELPTKTAR